MEKEKKKHSKVQNIVLIIVAAAILVGVCGWYVYYAQSSKYFKTDNAKVTGGIYQIVPTIPGKLVKLTVDVGDKVNADEIIGRVEGGTYLKSPVDGVVIKCDGKVNETVSAPSAVAVVADTSDLYIKANIEETDIKKIKTGETVLIDMDAYPGKKIHGHVDEVASLTSTALSSAATSFTTSGTYTKTTQLIPIKIKVDDKDISLEDIIGTNATVKIKVK